MIDPARMIITEQYLRDEKTETSFLTLRGDELTVYLWNVARVGYKSLRVVDVDGSTTILQVRALQERVRADKKRMDKAMRIEE